MTVAAPPSRPRADRLYPETGRVETHVVRHVLVLHE